MKLKDIKLFETENEIDFTESEITYSDYVDKLRKQATDLRKPFDETKYDGSNSINLISRIFTSLKGIPATINGDLDCFASSIKSIEFAPSIINGNFDLGSMSTALDFKKTPKMNIDGTFTYSTKSRVQFFKTKNICYLLQKVKCKHLVFGMVGQHGMEFADFIYNLNDRKNKGEDLEELIQEGAEWCAMHDYPSEFWGDIE